MRRGGTATGGQQQRRSRNSTPSTAQCNRELAYRCIYVCLSACVFVIIRVYALIARPKRGVAGLVPRSRA